MHPDKLCDRISDAILDACLQQDKDSRCAIETMGGHGIITITGELTTNAYIDCIDIAQRITGGKYGVQTNIVKQSPEIANGVDTGGAGDQGIMVGYACNENEEMIPQELYLARKLCKYLFKMQTEDGKTQITMEDGKVKTIVASWCNMGKEMLSIRIKEWIVNFLKRDIDKIEIFANPAGDWNIGGFEADTGLTGRKLAIDNYGSQIEIGGGAFSGKDATKVDRSGAYMARKIAVDYLTKHGAKEVKTKLAYCIGEKEPVMAIVEIDGKQEKVKGYDLTPQGIIEFLDLKKPQFEKTAEWGHFGNCFKWDY